VKLAAARYSVPDGVTSWRFDDLSVICQLERRLDLARGRPHHGAGRLPGAQPLADG